jgi:hypothetical protein
VGNVIVTALFAISFYLRSNQTGYVPATGALVFSFAGVALALLTGWLGAELVYRLGMGVDPGANLDAPNSLTSEASTVSDRKGTGYQKGLAPTGRNEEDDRRD